MPLTLEQVEAAGGYQVVLADPGWGYSNRGRGAAASHYRTDSGRRGIEETMALPVPRLAARDSVLFMWGVWPFLTEAFDVLRAWDFRYKTLGFLWVKYHDGSGKRCVGGGFWTRANTEFCLIATRGRNHPRRVDATVRQLHEEWPEGEEVCTYHRDEVLLAPRGAHSEKPPEVRRRIAQLMGPDVTKLEMNARSRDEGWDAWGDEAPGGSDVVF